MVCFVSHSITLTFVLVLLNIFKKTLNLDLKSGIRSPESACALPKALFHYSSELAGSVSAVFTEVQTKCFHLDRIQTLVCYNHNKNHLNPRGFSVIWDVVSAKLEDSTPWIIYTNSPATSSLFFFFPLLTIKHNPDVLWKNLKTI